MQQQFCMGKLTSTGFLDQALVQKKFELILNRFHLTALGNNQQKSSNNNK